MLCPLLGTSTAVVPLLGCWNRQPAKFTVRRRGSHIQHVLDYQVGHAPSYSHFQNWNSIYDIQCVPWFHQVWFHFIIHHVVERRGAAVCIARVKCKTGGSKVPLKTKGHQDYVITLGVGLSHVMPSIEWPGTAADGKGTLRAFDRNSLGLEDCTKCLDLLWRFIDGSSETFQVACIAWCSSTDFFKAIIYSHRCTDVPTYQTDNLSALCTPGSK